MSTNPIQIVVDIEALNIHLQVEFNGVPIFRELVLEQKLATLPSTTLARTGLNSLRAAPPPGIDRPKIGWVRLRVHEQEFGPEGGLLRDSPLGAWSWQPGDDENRKPPPDGSLISTDFTLSTRLPEWSWMKARPLSPAADGDAVRRTIYEVHRAFQARDYARLGASLRPKFDDEVTAYGGSFDNEVRIVRESLERNVSRNRRVIPLDESRWNLQWHAGGRLVEAVTKDWQPIVRAEGEGERNNYPLAMFLGMLGNEFKIVH